MQDIFDRGDARDGFFGKDPEFKRECARELAVQVDGTPTHAGNYAGMLNLWAFKLNQDYGLARAEEIGHDTNDFEVEFFYLVSGEDGVGVAVHPGLNLAQREDFVGFLGRKGGG